MLKWPDVIKFANNGNPVPDKRVEKTPEEWRELLTPEQFNITRLKGTERAFSSELCSAIRVTPTWDMFFRMDRSPADFAIA